MFFFYLSTRIDFFKFAIKVKLRKEDVKYNCRHFLGHIPCKPNKDYDVQCDNCSYYDNDDNSIEFLHSKEEKLNKIYELSNFSDTKFNISADIIQTKKIKVLFIKLGAIGDVIRTTPLLERFEKEYKNCHFTWITHSPQVLPKDKVDLVYLWEKKNIDVICNQNYDIVVNLDKDKEACILLSLVNAKKKYGFVWKNGHINTATDNADHKLITGFFDHISKVNKKNYLEEIFEICHFDFRGEEYQINLNQNLSYKWNKKIKYVSKNKHIIGLNTGCGLRWKTRLWPSKYWIELINLLHKNDFFCLLMGGPDEDEMNRYYQSKTDAMYLGVFDLEEFIAITQTTDIIVTPVSMMMHIAIALKKQLMLFHNIFNINEFELYDRGIIIEPRSGCDCYFGNSCSREKSCMNDISVQDVLSNIVLLNKKIKK